MPSVPRRRPSWWVALPALALLLVGLGWTAAWFYAASRAEREIDAWIALEAAQGRQWTCDNRQLGGYPFRFELICDTPSVTLEGPVAWTWKAARAHAAAQVWNPRHIIVEFAGPATLSESGTGRTLTAEWKLMQVSGTGTSERLERSSLAADDYRLSEGGSPLFAARHLELHVRQHPGAAGGPPGSAVVDIASSVTGATGLALLGGSPAAADTLGPVDGSLQVTVSGVPEFRAMPGEERLAQWQANGGRVKIDQAQLSAGGGLLAATGEVGLDAQRRLDGMITLSVAEAGKLLPALSGAGLMPEALTVIAPVLGAAGMPTQIDGVNASAFPFTFRNGRVSLGILPLGKIGPLY